jgi:glycosyltransferase involved in cell wall biosynthesis
MHIAFIGQKGIPALTGGVERYVEEVSARLAERGHEIFVYSRKQYAQSAYHRGVRCVRTWHLPGKYFATITHTLSSVGHLLFRKAGVDIIHVNSVGPALLMPFVRGVLMGQVLVTGRRPTVVFTFHSADWEHSKWGPFARAMLRLGAWCGRVSADQVVYVSQDMLDRFGSQTKGVYIPNGTEMESTTQTDNLHALGVTEGSYVLFAGRLVSHKHVHTLIQAFKQSSVASRYTLVIAGEHADTPEYAAHLEDLAQDESSIRFVGNQSGDALQQLFSHAAAYVLPSSSEGLSVSLLEATGMGIPAIVSDISQNREVVTSHAELVRPGYVTDLQEALENVFQDPSAAKARAQELQNVVRAQYSWKRVVDDLEQLYIQDMPTSRVTDYSYVA